MAEVKTGLEGRLGWFTECGTLGKVYYHALVGSAGTKACGIGTAATNGTNLVYFGSGYVNCSGAWVHVAQSTLAVGSCTGGTTQVQCYGVEVGSDGVVSKTTGTVAANVADAISARAGTTAGKCPLAYVTVGTSGSVLAGSIVNERSFHTSGSISYVTDFSYGWDMNKKDVFNRATFAHYKPGREMGNLSVKELYVEAGSADVWPTSSVYHTVPTIAMELAIDGVDGTASEVLLFQRCAKNSVGLAQPEDDMDTFDLSASFGSMSAFS